MRAETFARDSRLTLCDLHEESGVLFGTVGTSLSGEVAAYARTKGLRLDVFSVQPSIEHVVCERTPLYEAPDTASATVSEVSFGEGVRVYDARAGFVRIAALRDAYLGWVPAASLGSLPEPTHCFARLRGHVYAGPDVAARRVMALSYGAPLYVLGEQEGWSEVVLPTGSGFVQTGGLGALGARLELTPEAVTAFARRFLETPYLWGGVSAWGLDCSGLLQTVYGAFSVTLPRDSDQQAASGVGVEVSEVQAADLLFFPGHVALALDGERFVHANAHHMCVSVDSFADGGYGQHLLQSLRGVRRVLPG